MNTLLQNEDFFEMLIWGIVFVFVIIALFIINRFLRIGIGSRVKSRSVEFGMTHRDLDTLKKKGTLTEEEFKAVKQSMARQFLEMAKAEEEKRSKPGKAEVILAAAEEEVKRHPPAKKPGTPTPGVAPQPSIEEIRTRLPEHLALLAGKSDLELTELHQAGFLSHEDLEEIRAAQRTP